MMNDHAARNSREIDEIDEQGKDIDVHKQHPKLVIPVIYTSPLQSQKLEPLNLQTESRNLGSRPASRTFGSFLAVHSPIHTRPLRSLLPSPNTHGKREKTLPRSTRGSFFISHPSREEMGKEPRSLKSFMGDKWYDCSVRWMSWMSPISALLPPLNFITIHYTYFIITLLVTSLIFWGSSNPSKSISYVDSLFLVTSAMTEAGLNTVNLSTMTTFQQVILWLLIVVGSAIFVSVATVRTRKRAFEIRFGEVVGRQKEERRRDRLRSGSREAVESRRGDVGGADGSGFMNDAWKFPSIGGGKNGNGDEEIVGMNEGLKIRPAEGKTDENCMTAISEISPHGGIPKNTGDHITFAPDAYPASGKGKAKEITVGSSNDGTTTPAHSTNFLFPTSNPETNTLKHRINEIDTPLRRSQTGQQDLALLQYPSYLNSNTTGRNAQFHGLSRAEREHLGGVEYQAISFLAWLVPAYFILWQVLGGIGLGAYMAYNKSDVALENGINPWWLGVFNAISAFNNSGMSLLDLNMIPFQTSVYTLLTMGLLILAGNTAYPLFLRLILYTLLKLLDIFPNFLSPFQHHKPTLLFILRYPRRVYTNLFPSRATWWLLFMVITLNSIDWIAFELLNIGNSATQVIEPRYRVLDGLFQAIAVRSGGFYIISIPTLRIGLQFLYVVMMYISVYPVVITMRHSNVYEERSLGIYANDIDPSHTSRIGRRMKKLKRSFSGRELTTSSSEVTSPSQKDKDETTGTQFIHHQLRSQLSHDLWWLTLATLLIVCIEASSFQKDPITYSVFNVIFEVVSAYGCVGISIGLPDQDYSFSGGLRSASKVVLVAVMVRGRHRGLPMALDRAVRLPGWEGEGLGGEGGERGEG
ncbi:a8a07325-342f-4672-a8bc-cd904a5a23fa [Sclerotinia trifoliorum]|uniref:Potassium transport protein n=1 Tax=Sclerotinia trifoliorum TaxID=28548 RepID=A0A8H2W079_9HELO|nr:a8a07325-342f-4672-a8bc-cd904a5a23fa [Sclerotinia trifoliorum]